MEQAVTDLFWLTYGLSFLVMGLSITVRATGFPFSDLRNRLLALGAFGLFHAISALSTLPSFMALGGLDQITTIFTLAHYVALYYFVFGWQGRLRTRLIVHAVAAGVAGLLLILEYLPSEPERFSAIGWLGVGLPLSICAALTFLRDEAFEFRPGTATLSKRLIVIGFAVYAAMHLFSPPADVVLGSILNGDAFEAVTGLSVRLVRVVAIISVAIGVLSLLNTFEKAMRLAALESVSRTQDALHSKEAELYRTKKFLDLVVEHVPAMLFVKDAADLRFVLFNKAGEELLGYKRSELIGRNDYDFFPKEQADFFVKKDREVLRSGRLRIIPEEPIESRTKGNRLLQTKKMPVLDSDGKPMFLLGLSEDITEKKAAQEKLRTALAEAQRANVAKSNFIANMSHELRTPLNAILGFSEVMKTERLGRMGNPKYLQYAKDIHKSGSHLLAIVSDILSFSQLEAGKLELEDVGSVDTEALVNECANWISNDAKNLGVELRLDVDSEIAAMWGDERKLKQALLNLLSNAVKFSPKGGAVDIAAEEVEPECLRISVRDAGPGMAPDQIARIGEPFLQFDDTKSRVFGGIGLGLSIVKNIVELHGGTLQAESAPGERTTLSMIILKDKSISQASRRPKPNGSRRRLRISA